MDPHTILGKSPKGIEEINTRAHKLAARLRQVLIRVDGVKTTGTLCEEAGAMGETVQAQLEELLAQGFVKPVAGYLQPTAAQAAARAPLDPGSPIKFKLLDALVDALGADTGNLARALQQCRTREELAQWAAAAMRAIEAKAGASKAAAFEKAARGLLG